MIDYGTTRGALVPPGTYTVRLAVGKDTLARTVQVIADPRVTSSTADLVAQYQAARRAVDRVNDVVDAVKRVEDLQRQIDDRIGRLDGGAAVDSAKAVRARLEAVREELYEVGCHVDQCTLDMPTKLYNKLITLNMQLQSGAYAPTRQHGEIYETLNTQFERQLERLRQVEGDGLERLNGVLRDRGLPAVHVPTPKPVA